MRVEVLNDDERHPRVCGCVCEKLFQGLQSARRGADADKRNVAARVCRRRPFVMRFPYALLRLVRRCVKRPPGCCRGVYCSSCHNAFSTDTLCTGMNECVGSGIVSVCSIIFIMYRKSSPHSRDSFHEVHHEMTRCVGGRRHDHAGSHAYVRKGRRSGSCIEEIVLRMAGCGTYAANGSFDTTRRP